MVLLVEPGRPLTAVDVIDVLGVDVVAEIPIEAAVARCVDAGLLLTNLHRLSAFRALARLVQADLRPRQLDASDSAPSFEPVPPPPAGAPLLW